MSTGADLRPRTMALPSKQEDFVLDWLELVSGEDEPASHRHRRDYLPTTGALKRRHILMDGDENEHDNVEQTPRPQKTRRTQPSSQGATEPSTDLAPSESGDTLSNVSSTWSQSRSSSPSKRKRALQWSKPSFQFCDSVTFVERRESLESKSPLLRELIKAVFKANDALPDELKDFIIARQTVGDILRPPRFSPTLGRFAHLEPFLSRTIENTRNCRRKSALEGAWSDLVVLPTLQEAASLVGTEPEVDVVNVKEIAISPISLLPQLSGGGATRRNRVDYVLACPNPLPPDTITSLPGRCTSQSDHPWVAEHVFFSSLEIKQEHNAGDGMDQLAVWCGAGLNKLVEIGKTSRDRRTEPLQLVQCLWVWMGDSVTLHVAIEDKPDSILVLEVTKWSTMSAESLTRLVMTLVAVMEWGHGCYLEWFKTHVMG